MFNIFFEVIYRLNKRSRGHKNKLWKRIVAYIIYRTTSALIGLVINAVSFTRPDSIPVLNVTSDISNTYMDTRERLEKLTGFVHEKIQYYPMSRWIDPAHTLKLGIGDCKNQSALLQSMLKRCGIESELIIGLTNRNNGNPDVHAWVRVSIDGQDLICDPTMSGKAMESNEYKNAVHGLIDVTLEYLLKEPAASLYGVGTLSYLDRLTGKVK